MTRSSLTTGPPSGTPVPVSTTLHLRDWCNGITGRRAYLEAEGRSGAPGGPVAIATEHQDYEVNP
ncbi:hypothetical protein [Nonomuraea sp. NPDC049400]|uniref:hypothetical protein n=1 Tax=Nonomuraea sp. NPDC049400 TaxID=3364352 RepID=UPI0037964738